MSGESYKNGLVSIIMLSRNNGQYVADSVRSVQAQTYKDWELLFLDDSSEDDTISQMMDFLSSDKRIKVSHTIFERGSGINRNSAFREACGEWVAFIDAGDIWEPEKLERQIKFMNDNGYYSSYTAYESMDGKIAVKGPRHVNREKMMKNCWPEYLTVMYNAKQVGTIQVRYLYDNNDYALLLQLSKETDCYLLDECLARRRSKPMSWFKYSPLKRFAWRYEVYRKVERFNPFLACWMTFRNIYYGFVKKARYVRTTTR